MDKNTVIGKAVRTAIQAFIGFVVGLVVVVWHVPGVPEAVIGYTQNHFVMALVSIGLPVGVVSGVVAYVHNDVEKRLGK